MGDLAQNAGAVFPCHGKAHLIHQIAPEKRPGAAYRRPCGMDGAAPARPEKEAEAVVAAFERGLAAQISV